jgi:hypothetical protein
MRQLGQMRSLGARAAYLNYLFYKWPHEREDIFGVGFKNGGSGIPNMRMFSESPRETCISYRLSLGSLFEAADTSHRKTNLMTIFFTVQMYEHVCRAIWNKSLENVSRNFNILEKNTNKTNVFVQITSS